MALETLKGVEKIGGFGVMESIPCPDEIAGRVNDYSAPIVVDHLRNRISFRIQKGPVKENGVNGCQVDTIIAAALRIVTKLNDNFQSDHNVKAMHCLAQALSHLEDRRKDREARGVEGLNKK